MQVHFPFPIQPAYAAVIEIADDTDDALRARLLAAAYRSSARLPIALVLTGLLRWKVDRMLDPVVRTAGLGVAGVMYVDAADEDVVRWVLRQAPVIVASSAPFRARLLTGGIPFHAAEEVASALPDLIRTGGRIAQPA